MKNVLIVDDETRLTSTLISGLETFYAKDYAFLSAQNGQEAVQLLKSHPIDLVVTDLKMPVMNGFQLLAYMRSHYVSTPVIVLSAYGTKDIEARLKRLGCLNFMAKPVGFKDLADAIRDNLRNTSTAGVVKNISVAGFLQLIEMEYKTCMVDVRNRNTDHTGCFYFEKGTLYEAVCGDYKGTSAARMIIGWDDVEIKFDDRPNFKFKKRIQTQLITLLLDAMKEKDESSEEPQEQESEKSVKLKNEFSEVRQSSGKPVAFDEIADEISKKYNHSDDSLSRDTQSRVTETESKSSNTGTYKNNTAEVKKEPDMNVQKLNQAVEMMKKDLGDGLLATDIFMVADGVSIAAYNPQPKATALFNQLTTYIAETLRDSGFPSLGKYYLLDLVDDQMVIILPMGEYRWGILIDSSKIQLGLMLNIVIPKIIDAFEDAVTD
ncbi:response regulator [Desulfococcaceae bacterium HSG9]|nr:response regulator [Desulfococcaceae bacterium HSG9]